MKSLTFIEIDVDHCANTYGVAPCTASGPTKCFNSQASCQDRPNFINSPVTLRFSKPSQHLPMGIKAIPNIKDVSFTPATISLGQDLGQRATLQVTFVDHPDPDTGPAGDPYRTDRDYDPYKRGTYWGKFRARYPFLQGRPIRLIRGYLGQSLEDMDVRHYVIDSFDGPNFNGGYTIKAKDVLKLADNDKAKAPKLSVGFLNADLSDSATSFTIQPSGAGVTYPSSGYINIGGSEICAFTRSSDTFTITRAQFATAASTHQAQDRVQLCLQYSGDDPADIIYDLFVNYAGIDSSFIPLSTWQTETATYLQRVYTTLIAEPTGVNDLVSELIEQAALAIWWDDSTQQLKLQVLRAIPTTAQTFDEDVILSGSLGMSDQPSTRLSQVWTFYGLRNPLLKLDETSNYRSVELLLDLQSQSDYGVEAVKQIFSRWIPAFGRSVATRLNALILGRFKTPPRSFTFSLSREFNPQLGRGYRLEAYNIQDFTGARTNAPLQITRLNPGEAKYDIEAQEMIFVQLDESDLSDRIIVVDTNTVDFNLREVHDSLYPQITDPTDITVRVIISSGVIVGSSLTTIPAFDVGDWVDGLSITIECHGRIQGAGGKGGNYGQDGSPGGTALYARYPIDLEVSDGEIWGGGGGGGSGTAIFVFAPFGIGGGGGAGDIPGAGGASDPSFPSLSPGSNGTLIAGGAGAPIGSATGGTPGGTGGDPGLAGASATKAGGAAGNAIDGMSFVNVTAGPGDIRGPEVN